MINEMPIMSRRCVFDNLSPVAPPVFNLVHNFKNTLESTHNDSINSGDILEYSERSLPMDNSIHLAQTPCRDRRHSQLWDSGLGSPTPGSSPIKSSKFLDRFNGSQSPSLSPIPFTFNESEGNIMECSLTDVSNSNNSQNEFGFSLLPQTPVGQNYSLHSNRRIQFSQTKATKLQRSMKKMKLSTSPPSTHSTINKSNKQNKPRTLTKMRSRPKVLFSTSSPQANVNPFISIRSDSKTVKSGLKRCRDHSDSSFCLDSSLEEHHPSRKMSLKEMNVCRFREEFHVLRRIGDGQFGSVYKCINRLDGCVYAIKRSQTPVAGSVLETNAVNEVYAHAVLGKHQHIIGYYSSWVEMDRVFIQTEFCNGGNLSNIISKNKQQGRTFTETELSILLSQLADGLAYIHSQNLVHLDVKPDNILICYKKHGEVLSPNTDEDSYTYQEIVPQLSTSDITYKIGDFGMVTSAITPTFNEGDCRYLPREILQENTTDIQKADIFSLSLTVFEAGSGTCMPLNGPVWQEYRVMGLPELKGLCGGFNALLKQMSSCDPILRPTASNVVREVAFFSKVQCSNNQIARELTEQKKENEKLRQQIQALIAQEGQRYVGKFCHKSQTMS